MKENSIRSQWRPLLAAALTMILLLPGASSAKNRYDKVKESIPELRDFQIPEVTREVLANGLVIYLVEDHDLPVVKMAATIKVGAIYEPAAKVGLAGITGEVMRTGGTADFPGDELDIFLENLGASVESGISATSGSASMNCLTENLNDVLRVFAGVLRDPAFPDDKIDLAKTQRKTEISRRNDDAGDISWREIMKLYYGEGSPYSRQEEYDTVAAIERRDLVDFHEYFYHPNNTILVVGGDFEKSHMLGLLRRAFGDWERVETFYPPDPVLTETEPSVNYIFKEDVNQSKVRMGHLGIKHDDEYLFPLQVMNQILGGGFSSRLFNEVRTKQELAYAVFAWMIVGDHHRMPFVVGVDTKSGSTVKAIEIIRHELDRIVSEPVTDVELHAAKEGLKNSFVFNFSSPYSIAKTKASYEFWGKDPAYLDTYIEKVGAVTANDILEAAKARIHPEEMAILVVGRADDFDKPLSSLGMGEPNEIDVTIPEPSFAAEAVPAATPESLAAGLAIMGKVLAAHGGLSQAKAIRSLETNGDLTVHETGMGPLTFGIRTRVEGDSKMRVDMNTPFGSMTTVIAGESGWSKSPRGKQTLASEDIADSWKEQRRQASRLLLRLEELKAQAGGMQDLDGKSCQVVYVSGEGIEPIKYFIDPQNWLPVAMEFKDSGETGPVLNRTYLGDYRKAGGFQFARELKIHHDGKLFATVIVGEVNVNPKFDPGLFGEPGD